MITGRRLPYQERIRLKKLAQRTKARNLRQIKSLRIDTLNVGSKKYRVDKDDGKKRHKHYVYSRDKMEGAKAKEIGDGFKLFCSGTRNKRNGVGVILEKELKENVIGVTRVSDRVMSLRVLTGKEVCRIVSAHAPQVGCDKEEEVFWE